MTLCACKCLNVIIESDLVDDNVDIGKLELTSTEQRDTFFNEKLLSAATEDLKLHIVQPTLIGQRLVGRWLLNTCLACDQTTHATLQDRNAISTTLILKSLQTTQEQINNLKNSKNYSTIFHILVPEVTSDIEMKENVDTNNYIISGKKEWVPTHQVIGTLSKQMNQMLQSQLEAVEETVRQFRDQKYAEFEAYKERAQREHKILSSVVSKARTNLDNNVKNLELSLQNEPPSPNLPPLQRRRLSSLKDAKKLQHNTVKTHKSLPPEDDSLDADDLFDLEGTDSQNMISDQDDYESDEGSNDEGGSIAISRARGGGGGGGAGDIARSLPMNVPRFPNDRSSVRDLDDDAFEEPQDIAASIKALARSVHGDVFDLPRPRFSTQI